MNPKELRKKILEILYEKRSEDFVDPSYLLDIISVTESDLDTEIRYLEGKNLAEIMLQYMGKKYLNFHGLKITPGGVDLVENSEEFGRLFSIKINANNFGDIRNSNVVIDAKKSKQTIGIIDEGLGNRYENVQTEGSDIGMINKGKNTTVMNFKHLKQNLVKGWHTTWWGLLVLTITAGMVVGGLIYLFGWN